MQKPFSHPFVHALIAAACFTFFSSCGKGLIEQPKEQLTREKKANSSMPLHCPYLVDPCSDPACEPFFLCEEVPPAEYYYGQYAGVTIVYEVNPNILNFNSEADLATVLGQLDADYEAHNDNYENQYPTLTPEQLDDMDQITGFDEFATYRTFENLFPGYSSRRSFIENAEELWLSQNMTGTDPSDYDLTFDNSENAVAGSNYQVKVAGQVYAISAEDVGTQGSFAPLMLDCSTNKKKKKTLTAPDGSRRFELKAAINSWWVRSSVKGKVVSYVKKGSRWKRSRVNLKVFSSGTIFNNGCTSSFPYYISKPGSGYKKKKELKAVTHQGGTWWKKQANTISASFEAQNITTGSVTF